MRAELDKNDMGVDRFNKRPIEELEMMLSYPNSRPAHWNTLRCSDAAITPWDDGIDGRYNIEHEDIHELKLLWHQLVGTAAMVDRLWTAKQSWRPDVNLDDPEEGRVPGVLLADDVGIGKTSQIISLIAFLQQVYRIEADEGQKLPRPPLIGQSRWLELIVILRC